MSDKPLFVPLKTQYFRAFEAGIKTIEYRRAGPLWNERRCWIGRPVTLSHGYSGSRLYTRIKSVQRVPASVLPDPEPYAPGDELLAIELEVLGPIER
ncbi:MAG: hypothetical protein ACP5P4_16965 [Steroidobacteraceae bacterium]